MNHNIFSDDNKEYYFFPSKITNQFKSSSKEEKSIKSTFKSTSKENKDINCLFKSKKPISKSSNIKNSNKTQKLFSSSSYSNKSFNSKEKDLLLENNNRSDNSDLNLNESDSIISFSKLKDIKSSQFYSDGKRGNNKAKKVIHNNKREVRIIISNDKNINEEVENDNHLSPQSKKNKKNKKKSTLQNSLLEKAIKIVNGQNNNLLNKKRNRPKHTDLYSDNRKEKIKTSFFNSIFLMINDDLKKFKKLKPFYIYPEMVKIQPYLHSLNRDKDFNIALSLKVKNILYTDRDIKIFFHKKNKNENDKNSINKVKLDNSNNKEIINKIEKINININQEKNEKIKECSLKLNEIFNYSLEKMYSQYINDVKCFDNYQTLKNELENQRKKGKNESYIELLKQKAFEMLNNYKKILISKNKANK